VQDRIIKNLCDLEELMIKTNCVYVVYNNKQVSLSISNSVNSKIGELHSQICKEFENVSNISNDIKSHVKSYHSFSFLKKSLKSIQEISSSFMRETGGSVVEMLVESSIKSQLSKEDMVGSSSKYM